MISIPPDSPWLDTRSEQDFLKAHRAGAVNIPLDQLTERIHELPPPYALLVIFDWDERRARWAASRLRCRGRVNLIVQSGQEILNAGPIETGASPAVLWRPHALLVTGLNAIETTWGSLQGRHALDLACGTGRDAVFMAIRGLDVQAWDILPDALAKCRDLATRSRVHVQTIQRDVERDPSLPDSELDLITCFNFLHRPLWAEVRRALRPGGFLIHETFALPQRELFGKPARDAHLLGTHELALEFNDWHILHASEGLASPRRFVASLIAMKPLL